ncbi:VOC family protein [Spirillospora sp. NPDC048911]|uniref:VOC family protein n=1 Tax=Spirillospora sp. NPDC048911 TaxID=3364527 RepID=UPI003710CF0A
MAVTVDCAEPRRLAEWWATATGGEITVDYEFYVAVGTPGGPVLGFQRVTEPTPGKNRWHLDFKVSDRATEIDRLTGLGATVVDTHTVPGLTWTVLTDPDGNQFCISADH